MDSIRYTPQEAATVAELPLAAVQKAITSKQLPAQLAGKPPRRKIDELSLLALALAHRLPKKIALTITEARRALEKQHITRAKDARTHLIVGGTVRVDLVEVLGPVLDRLQLYERAQAMIAEPTDGGDPVIKGTKIRPVEIRDRLARGETKEKLHADFPLLTVETIEAAALWADATPRRGRPKKRAAPNGHHLPVPRDMSTWTRTMQITSQQIDGWAHSEAARSLLPLLVRRLINTAGSITQISFPGRDSTNLPDWDGELMSQAGSPWVPTGRSFWELSCEDNPTSKANRDYERRTAQTPKATKRQGTYVVVTARRWSQKKKWLTEKRAAKDWSEVRAYDADDLEQALETNPAVALWLADELGLAGTGVESPTRFWETWAEQSAPPLTMEAIFAARDDKRRGLVEDIRKRIETGNVEPLLVTADSVGEAVAFVCAAISTEADLAASALVITDNAGWKFVEQNHVLKIAITSRTEIAESPARRKGLVVIIPYAVGDFPAQFRGIAGRQADAIAFELPRPKSHEFEEALTGIGVDKSDAKRLASSTGRSWSVYRRHRAVNPALRSPAWLEMPQSRALSTLCLLGSWSGGNAADKQIVSRVANRAYEELERDLRELSTMDDAPVLAIGQVWKAKSSLELLDLYGQHIPSTEVERFLDSAKEILTAEDPQLDLEEEKRYAAAVYGKVRPETGLLRDAICDTLVKLAVTGPEISSLAGLHIDSRIGRFVHDLLNEATPRRWLSLASYLPHLAEAAPDQFLRAIDASLAAPGAPVTQLIAETSSGITGRCWHAGLLWALERLAWAPNRVRKVALILARLCHVPFKSNWANTPLASLNGIFRTWLPQTAATVEQRIGHLDALMTQEPDIAFSLLERLVNLGHDVATPAARPEWRDDDAGAGHGVTRRDHAAMLVAVADRLLSSAAGNAGRVAKVISHIEQLGQIDGVDKPNPSRVERAMALVEGHASDTVSDEDREIVRAQLRERIYWHRNYGDGKRFPLTSVNSMDSLYARLAPRDPIIRNRWLFEKSWLNLPMRVRDDDYTARSGAVQSLRKAALWEIIAAKGLSGVKSLLQMCPTATEIGVSLAEQNLDVTTLANWIVSASQDVSWNDPMRAAVQGLLRSIEGASSLEIVRTVLDVGRSSRWPQESLVNFLAAARDERATWDVVASCGEDVEKAYWDTSRPGFWLRDKPDDFQFVLRKLIEAKRPRTALQVCHMDFDKVEPLLLADLLEGMLRGEEKDGPLLQSWDIANAIKRLEQPGVLPQDRLIRLEFGLVPTLGFQGEQKARALYRALLEQPELFVQLLCFVYRAENTEKREEDVSEGERNAAHIAWDILHHCRRLPGWTDPGSGRISSAQRVEPDDDDDDDDSVPTKQIVGRIDAVKFDAFVREARQLAAAEGRGKVCDMTLGQIMAYAPTDDDGTWPCLPVRDFLERADCEEARNGFSTGTYNRRGVHWRSMDDGGSQERELAKTYRSYAHTIVDTHPTLAATLDGIARGYDNEALREDLDARLRVEGN